MIIFSKTEWHQRNQMVSEQPWYQSVVDRMQQQVDELLSDPITVPKEAGGWIHRYISPSNWMPLIYDRYSPQLHNSPLGDSYTGSDYDGAWRVWRHRELTNLARDCGLLFQLTGDKHYADASIHILNQYAQIYLDFNGDWDADGWMLKGRAMNQALTEALWAYPLILAYDLVSDELPNATEIQTKLLHPILETLTSAHNVLLERNELNHNYTAWLLAVIGCIGATLNDTELVDKVVNGTGGFKEHIEVAILADGLEREATPYYHNFVVLAYSILAQAVSPFSYDLYNFQGTKGQSIERMWQSFAQLALPDGSVIEVNDGSYWKNSIYDVEICEVLEVAYAKTDDPTYAWLLDKAYQRCNTTRSNWTALLYAKAALNAKAPKLQTQHLMESGLSVLHEDDWSIYVPSGDYAGGHSHLDRMGLSIYPFSLDAGSPLYGIEERKTWYTQSLAHNVIVVDKASQNKGQARCVSYSNKHIILESDQLYDGVTLRREIKIDGAIFDHYEAISNIDHTYDFLFYSDAPWETKLLNLETYDYPYAETDTGKNIRIYATTTLDQPITIITQYKDKTYQLILRVDQPYQLLLAMTPGRSHKPYQQRHVLIARVKAHSVVYTTKITVKNNV